MIRKLPNDLDQPIVIPFVGIRDQSSIGEGLLKRFEKLFRLADHYGIEQKGDPGWGFALALKIASDLHPGFEFVHDDWNARVFKSLCDKIGTKPLFRMKEGDNPDHRPAGTGWAPMLVPEFVALFVDTFKATQGGKRRSDVWWCEQMVISFDPDLGKPTRKAEKRSGRLP